MIARLGCALLLTSFLAAPAAADTCTPPSAPPSVTATGGGNGLVATWRAATGEGITGYVAQAFRNATPGPATATGPGVTTATITGVPAGAGWAVAVRAVSACGAGPSRSTTATTVDGAGTTYAGAVIGDRPLAYYRLGEEVASTLAADSSGLGHPLAYRRRTAVPGALGTDADRATNRGPDTCCLARGPVPLPYGNEPRSVEAWIRGDNRKWTSIAGWGTNENPGNRFTFGTRDDRLTVDTLAGGVSFDAGRRLTDGAWHHVAMTYDGEQFTGWVDGARIGRQRVAPLATFPREDLVVGAGVDEFPVWIGDLDEVAVYGTALTGAQIAAHITAAGYGVVAPGTVTATPGPNAITATWTAPATGERPTAYRVTALRGAGPVASVVAAASATSARLTGLPGGQEYTVRVTAVNRFGDGPAGISAPLTPTGSRSTYAGAVQDDDPVAFYRFQEAAGSSSVADSTGTQPLTLYGGTSAPGAAGPDDRGGESRVTAPLARGAVTGLPLNDDERTVEAWVRPKDAAKACVAGWGAAGAWFDVSVSGTAVGVNTLVFPVTTRITDGAWHQVAATATAGGSVRAYLDGVLLGTRDLPAGLDTGGPTSLHAAACHDDTNRVNGGFDELSVYASVLSPERIAAHYAEITRSGSSTVTGVSVSARENAVAVSWAAGNADEYVVRVLDGTTPANARSLPAGTTSTVMSGLPAGVPVTVEVTPFTADRAGTAGTSAPVTPTGAASTYASTVRADAPSAYYRLGEPTGARTLADSAGAAGRLTVGAARFGRPAPVTGDPDTGVTGVVASGRVALPKGNRARTVEAWMSPGRAQDRWLVSYGGPAGSFAVGVSRQAVLVDAGERLRFPAGRPLTFGVWHHVAVTYDDEHVTAFLDGESLGVKEVARLTTAARPTLTVGSPEAADDGLDEVAVYPQALDADRIRAHAAAAAYTPVSRIRNFSVSSLRNGLRATWTLTPGVTPQRYLLRADIGYGAIAEVLPNTATSGELTGLLGGADYDVQLVPLFAAGDGVPGVATQVPIGSNLDLPYATRVLSGHPVAYYRLGEPAGTPLAAGSGGAVGSAGLLRVLGGSFGVTFGATGALRSDPDRAVDTTAGVGVARVAGLPRKNDPRSLEAWVRPADDGLHWVAGYGTWTVFQGRDFMMGTQDDAVVLDIGGVRTVFPAHRELADRAWHHVVVSYDGTQVTAYADGVSLGAQTPARAVETNPDGLLRIGTNLSGTPAGLMAGGLDEVAVYGSAMSAGTVLDHYRASGR